MPICTQCGEEIAFRYVNGRPTPIHVHGGWCRGSGGGSGLSSPLAGSFRTVASYINPNAYCPICGQSVYFYQSPYGGRVFFDDVGWPWPKHPCTDRKAAQTRPVHKTKIATIRGISLRNESGQQLDVYALAKMARNGEGWDLKFARTRDHRVFRGYLSDKQMKSEKLVEDDFRHAPSFVATPPVPGLPTRKVEFICERRKGIATIDLPKTSPSSSQSPLPAP